MDMGWFYILVVVKSAIYKASIFFEILSSILLKKILGSEIVSL